MSYGVKYRIQVATQAESTVILDVLEQDYTSSIIIYDATALNIQYIPSSDDPFEPIIASQLSVSIDVTDFIDDMPNFVSLNDRKYLCKLYDSNISMDPIWVGWILTDSVQFPFTTGIKEISFNAICGLGMLNYITYNTLSSNTLFKHSLLQIILNCLNSLQFETNLNLFTACSIYSSQMLDRTDGDEYEPFAQTYISLNSLQSSGVYKTCLEILREILISFGCRIIQSNGEWNILQINQQANEENYYTRYDNAGTVIDSGTYSKIKNIPNDGLFIGNSQNKIIQKGFNNIISNNKITYNDNQFYNGNFAVQNGTNPDGWTIDFSGSTGTWAGLTQLYTGSYNVVSMIGGGGVYNAKLSYNGSIFIGKNETTKISFVPYALQGTIAGSIKCYLDIRLVAAGVTYYYDVNEVWQIFTSPGASNFYEVKDIPENKPFELKLNDVPDNGQLVFSLFIGNLSDNFIAVGNFSINVSNQIEQINIESKINDENAYTKEVQLYYGLNPKVYGKYSFNGFISDSTGAMLTKWYMMERPTDTYYSLAELTVKNYVNQFRKNIINVDSTIELYELTGNEVLDFADIDPNQISTETKKYLIGNNVYQYNIQELQGILLEISNINQEAIITTEYIYPDVQKVPAYSRRIVGATTTSGAACALTPYGSLRAYFVNTNLLVGDIVYTTDRLISTFNGANLYWKIEREETHQNFYAKISNVGVIIEVNNC